MKNVWMMDGWMCEKCPERYFDVNKIADELTITMYPSNRCINAARQKIWVEQTDGHRKQKQKTTTAFRGCRVKQRSDGGEDSEDPKDGANETRNIRVTNVVKGAVDEPI